MSDDSTWSVPTNKGDRGSLVDRPLVMWGSDDKVEFAEFAEVVPNARRAVVDEANGTAE